MSNEDARLKKPPSLYLEVWSRDKWTCQYCGYRAQDFKTWWNGHFSLDHVVPLAHGGSHSTDNLVVTCGQCNNHKRDFYDDGMADLPLDARISIVREHLAQMASTQHSAWYRKFVEGNLNGDPQQSFLEGL